MNNEVVKPRGRKFSSMAIEAVLIVLSILLAFSIDAWWDERKERIEEHEVLTGLKEEFTQYRAVLGKRHEDLKGIMLGTEKILESNLAGRWVSEDWTFDDALSQVLRPPTTDLQGGVMEALRSSGQFSLISNKKLRFMLASWESTISEVTDDELLDRNLVFQTLIPYLVEHGVSLSGGLGKHWLVWPVETESITSKPDEFSNLLNDASFAVAVEAAYIFKEHTLGEYEAALQAIDGILIEIDESL